ncbi:MAG: hypothetical protein MPW14_13005 [Candidatus Manganitrophus sp.]|nr:MAG: hypothetical protein MPW14_13005 [Candidatus Manganitrophus sp.]
MSLCILGMAEAFKAKEIAVNSLWPQTAIATAAMVSLAGEVALQRCRRPEIMADAAYLILTKSSRECTGNFFLDEALLRSAGITDFDRYAVSPGTPLIPDLFV